MNGFKDHFSGHAAQYADCRPGYPVALAAALAGLVARRDTALDCGCGSGQLSVLLANEFATVHANDASAQQIGHAMAHPRVRYAVRPAEDSGLPPRSVDLVVAAQAAHWFDLPRYWAEVARVLRPGGVTVLVGYGLLQVDEAVDAMVAGFYGEAGIGGFWPPERRLIDSGYRDIAFPFREVAPPRVEMASTWTRAQLLGYIATWSAVKAAETQGLDPMTDFAAGLAEAWPDGETARRVRWPLLLRVGVGTAP